MPNPVTVSDGQNRIESLTKEFQKDCGFKIKPAWPVTSNWASKLAHPCERWLYHNRVNWEEREQRDWKGIGELGEILHDKWKRDMISKGYQIIHAEVPLSAKLRNDLIISGKIDGRIGKDVIRPSLYEFKSMNPYDYEKINTWDDILNHKKDYIRTYAGQITIYLFDQNEEVGLLVIMNKSTLEWKWIIVYLEYELAEWMLQRAERVNKAVIKKEPPDRIPFGKTCESCEYKAVCLPDILNSGIEMIDNERLQFLLEEREKLKVAHSDYENIDDEAKTMAKAVGKNFMCGTDWMVEFRNRTSRRIDTKAIPAEVRSQYEVETKTQNIIFVPLNFGHGK